MYIEPNTNIRILKDIPLDPTYDHTIWFANADNQFYYFSAKTYRWFEKQSYTRVQRGRIRVNMQAELLYNCNYLMFQNSAFGTKWFYAFIRSVEYINNNVSEIQFQIDVMQTWMFDYQLEECFVEREHTASDKLFEHTVAEDVDIGERRKYVNEDKLSFDNLDCILIRTIDSTIIGDNQFKYINPFKYDVGTFESIATLVNSLISGGVSDSIIQIIAFPHDLVSWHDSEGSSIHKIPRTRTIQFDYNLSSKGNSQKFNLFSTIDGYEPKNKKLFTYPYYYLHCTNRLGNVSVYKFENFADINEFVGYPTFRFNCEGTLIGSPYITCYPIKYNGVKNNYDEGLIISQFADYPWTSDAFAQWLNRNQYATSFSLLSASLTGVLHGAGALATGRPMGALYSAASTFTQIGSIMSGIKDIQNIPSQAHGEYQGAFYNMVQNIYGYTFYTSTITREYAEMIDDYFSRFGYACKRSKVPNTNVRPHWTYTKTLGCTIKGSIPSDDADAICNIYNNGITFWNNGETVGRYDLDNSV